MRLYYTVSGIILILPIINFAVAAPVLVQERRQTGINVVYTPKEAMTISRKRGNELDEMWLEVLGHPESNFLPKLEKLSAPHPLSNPPPSGPADVSMDFEQPLHEELLPDSGHYVPPSLGDKWYMMWHDTAEGHLPAKPEESSAARPFSSSHPSGSAGGSMDVERPQPSILKEPSQVSSPDRALPSPGDALNKLWLNLVGPPESHFFSKPEESSAARPSSSSQPQPYIPKEPSQVSSPDRALSSPGDVMNKMWLNLIGPPESHFFSKPEGSSAARPSSSSQPSGPAGRSMDVEPLLPSIPEEASQVSSSDHAPPGPRSLKGSGYTDDMS